MQQNSMSTVALILGIISIIVSFFFGAGIVVGVVGITFALLSRRLRMNTSALIGLILSITGIIASFFILIVLIAFLSSSDLTKYLEKFEINPDDSIYYFNDDYDFYDDYNYDDQYLPYEHPGFDEYFDFYNGDYFNFGYNDNNYGGDQKL